MTKLFCGKKILDFLPVVMGILNLTPDSFFDGGQFMNPDEQMRQAEKMLDEGASIIDIGAQSTRPGATEVDEEEELRRLLPALNNVTQHFPEAILSVDTFHPRIAREAAAHGACIINDIYGGRHSEDMLETVASLNLPFILMHMKGTPANMQESPVYSDVVAEVLYFFENRLAQCRNEGIHQIIIDPGFGFGKTTGQNYTLLAQLSQFKMLGMPILAGISRKSMITKTLNIKASETLNGTTILNTIALINGADILRVHDVKEAVEAIRLVGMLGNRENG